LSVSAKGRDIGGAKGIKEIRMENTKLKFLVAEVELWEMMLKEIDTGNSERND
jgi:hypothetical protein